MPRRRRLLRIRRRYARRAGAGDGGARREQLRLVDRSGPTDALRARLHTLLRGSSWWGGSHATVDCERFADALAWAYWPSPENPLGPSGVDPAAFRALLGLLLPPPVRGPASRR
jgi:hypothetical protein